MTLPDQAGTHDPPMRGEYRVPIGMPVRDEGRRSGVVISVLIHALIIALVIIPVFYSTTIIQKIEQGAGGAGPAGGGGGGNTGGGYHETLRFVRVAPTPVPTPTKLPPVPPPVLPKMQQVLPPPEQPLQPVKAPEQSIAPVPIAAANGDGAGSGRDGSAGNGPGSGGGVGSGNGPGRGSGNGPGTGGGRQENYPPVPIEVFLPPMPSPASVKGTHVAVEFDVDSTGRVLHFDFSETRDGDYNHRLASVLRSMHFKPGTRPDGTPIRMKAQFSWDI